LRAVSYFAFFGGFSLLLGGFMGALHPLGDSLAVFRINVTALCVFSCVLIAIWAKRWAILGAICCLVSTATIVGPTGFAITMPHDALGLYQKNLSFRMQDTDPLVQDIFLLKPNVVTLQEVSPTQLRILEDLDEAYPHQAVCPFHSFIGGVAVLSQHPITETRCVEGSGLVAARVNPEAQEPFWVVSLHLRWPFPYSQSDHVKTLLPQLENLKGDVLIGGDFNMVPWGHTVRLIRNATGTTNTEGLFSTFTRFGKFVPLQIDHVLGPGGGTAKLRPNLGSDHLGLYARVRF